MSYNICQITNFSQEVITASIISRDVYVEKKYSNEESEENKTIKVNYYSLPSSVLTKNLDNNISSDNASIIKLGYVCEPRGIGYPIIIRTGNVDNQKEIIYLGKTGMYEIMPENFINTDDISDITISTHTPQVTQILIPKCQIDKITGEEIENPIQFKLDYIYISN